jgi:hypothetical protein
MASNYYPWDINLLNFPSNGSIGQKIEFLLRFAVLAPSGHNTQPWNFEIKGNSVLLLINKERSLRGSDPERRQLLIGFGCMIENLCIAATYYDMVADIDYGTDLLVSNHVGTVTFSQRLKEESNSAELISAIPKRHTSRGKYLDKPLPVHFFERIHAEIPESISVTIVNGERDKDRIAEIINEAGIAAMDSDTFREELSHFIRSNYTKAPTGMPGFALELPGPISLIASRLIKKVNLSRASKKKDLELLQKHTPGGFIIISSRGDGPMDRIACGRFFERIWLLATANDLACSPMAAAVQSEEYRSRIQHVANIAFEPQIFFRIGYSAKQFRHSPRFSIEQLLIK